MRSASGHRQRVKQRFRNEGLDNFEESHALELLLFYAVPRRDTKPLARRLLDEFGSFAKVLEADLDALRAVEGVGIETATFLNLLHQTGRYYQVSASQPTSVFKTVDECGDYLVRRYFGSSKEIVSMMCLDAKSKLICFREISSGTVNATEVSVRKLVEIAMLSGATSVILAHNHPDGDAYPSEDDVMVTKKLARALASLGVIVADHIIVTNSTYCSMAASGFYNPQDTKLSV